VPTREQVRELLGSGMDYETAGQRLSNPPPHNPTSKESVRQWMAARTAADGQMQAAKRQRTAEPPEIQDESHDAITVLGRQHGQVHYLLKQLEALPGYTKGGSAERISERKSIADMITVRLSEHETIEEEHFWPAVRRALPDGDHYADTALRQEQEGKDTLTELGKLDPGTREFDEHVERFVAEVRKHVAFEDLVFLKMRETMSREDLDRLGEKLLSAMKTAADKARDAAGDRPAKRKGKAKAKAKDKSELHLRQRGRKPVHGRPDMDRRVAGLPSAQEHGSARPGCRRQERGQFPAGPADQDRGQIGQVRLPVLRGGLRAERLRLRREGHPDRG